MKSESLVRSCIFVVNEPGEFKELLKLADAMTRRGTQTCTFIFCRPDYVAYGAHYELCQERGYFSVKPTPNFSSQPIVLALSDTYQDDYIPSQRNLDARDGDGLDVAIPKPRRTPRSKNAEFWKVLSLFITPFWMAARLVRPRGKLTAMLHGIKEIGVSADRYKAMKSFFYAVCKLQDADLIVYGQDYAGSFNSVASIMAHDVLDIPVVTLPFAMGTTKELNEALLYYPTYHADATRFSRWVAKKYPRWVNVYKGQRLLRLPPWEIVAAELEGAIAPYPWLPYSGNAFFLASSEQARDYYVRAGMDPDLIIVTGSFNDALWSDEGQVKSSEFSKRRIEFLRSRDEIRQRTRQMIGDAIGSRLIRETDTITASEDDRPSPEGDFLGAFITNPIDQSELRKRQIVASTALAETMLRGKNKPSSSVKEKQRLIVVSWPTNQFSRPMPGISFKDHEHLSKFWANTLSEAAQEHGAMVMVSLHPTLLNQDYSWLEEEHAFTIWPGALTEILPLADLFVACVSSTLLWAANLGVPSINYDCYRYGYREFDETGVIKTVSVKSDFVEILDQALSDAKFYQSLKDGAAESRGYWGFFDGQSEDRIIAAIDRIVRKETVARKVSETAFVNEVTDATPPPKTSKS